MEMQISVFFLKGGIKEGKQAGISRQTPQLLSVDQVQQQLKEDRKHLTLLFKFKHQKLPNLQLSKTAIGIK